MSCNLSRLKNETELSYIWRLGQAKDNGLINMTWTELAEVLNQNLRDPDEYYGESVYRKRYSLLKQAKDEVFQSTPDDSELVDELRNERHELYKERVRLADERRELNATLRAKAREENFLDQIRAVLDEFEYQPVKPLPYLRSMETNEDVAMLIPCYDIHWGINIDSAWNKFNPEIAHERFNRYLIRIRDIQKVHGAQNAYVVISEGVSGLIHTTLRCESNENVVRQLMGVVNLLIWFLMQLSGIFESVNVYVAPGNHSRLFEKKDNCLKGENLDHLAMYCLKGYLQNIDNIVFYENELDEGIACFNVCGNKVFAAHGDKDAPETICRHITEMMRIVPDICLLGHKHFNSMTTVNGGAKVIQTGSFSGPDSYCADARLQGQAEQAVAIIDKHGLNCVYDVTLA